MEDQNKTTVTSDSTTPTPAKSSNKKKLIAGGLAALAVIGVASFLIFAPKDSGNLFKGSMRGLEEPRSPSGADVELASSNRETYGLERLSIAVSNRNPNKLNIKGTFGKNDADNNTGTKHSYDKKSNSKPLKWEITPTEITKKYFLTSKLYKSTDLEAAIAALKNNSLNFENDNVPMKNPYEPSHIGTPGGFEGKTSDLFKDKGLVDPIREKTIDAEFSTRSLDSVVKTDFGTSASAEMSATLYGIGTTDETVDSIVIEGGTTFKDMESMTGIVETQSYKDSAASAGFKRTTTGTTALPAGTFVAPAPATTTTLRESESASLNNFLVAHALDSSTSPTAIIECITVQEDPISVDCGSDIPAVGDYSVLISGDSDVYIAAIDVEVVDSSTAPAAAPSPVAGPNLVITKITQLPDKNLVQIDYTDSIDWQAGKSYSTVCTQSDSKYIYGNTLSKNIRLNLGATSGTNNCKVGISQNATTDIATWQNPSKWTRTSESFPINMITTAAPGPATKSATATPIASDATQAAADAAAKTTADAASSVASTSDKLTITGSSATASNITLNTSDTGKLTADELYIIQCQEGTSPLAIYYGTESIGTQIFVAPKPSTTYKCTIGVMTKAKYATFSGIDSEWTRLSNSVNVTTPDNFVDATKLAADAAVKAAADAAAKAAAAKAATDAAAAKAAADAATKAATDAAAVKAAADAAAKAAAAKAATDAAATKAQQALIDTQNQLDAVKRQLAAEQAKSGSADAETKALLLSLQKQLNDQKATIATTTVSSPVSSTTTSTTTTTVAKATDDKCTVANDSAFTAVCKSGIITENRPSDSVKRYEVALMFARLAKTITSNNKGDNSLSNVTFKDENTFATQIWHNELKDSLKYGTLKGYGDGTLKPGSLLNFAELYRSFYNLYKTLGLATDFERSQLKDAVEYLRQNDSNFQLSSDNQWYVEGIQFVLDKRFKLVSASKLSATVTRNDVVGLIYQAL